MKIQYRTKFLTILFLSCPLFGEAGEGKKVAPVAPPPRYSDVVSSGNRIVEEDSILPVAVTYNKATCFASYTLPGATYGNITAMDANGYRARVAQNGIFPTYRFGEIWARRVCYILKQRGVCTSCTAELASYNKYYYGLGAEE